jgi:hypothetical protein
LPIVNLAAANSSFEESALKPTTLTEDPVTGYCGDFEFPL